MLLPASAGAATIQGNPLTIYISGDGSLQARIAGTSTNVFYPPGSQSEGAGLFLGLPRDIGFGANVVGGPPNLPPTTTPFTPVSQGSVSGSGTASDPFIQVTTYQLASGGTTYADVTQGVSYVNGSLQFSVSYQVAPTGGRSYTVRVSTAADLYMAGNDTGVGTFRAGPPRFVAGVNQETGNSGGIQEVGSRPWSHYEENDFTTIWNRVRDALGPGFADSVNPNVVDNGVGVQWDDHYAPGSELSGPASYYVTWAFTGSRGGTSGVPPPVLGKSVNVEPVSGQVYVGTPAGGARSSAKVNGIKGVNFVPLRKLNQIPVGSYIDTRRGTVRLTSAANTSGATQSGKFTKGVFAVSQAHSALTTLTAKGASFKRCRTRRRRARKGSLAEAARSRRTIRRLSGNAHGRFRTRGRFSSATVRGTVWGVIDRCDGTLTRVQRGRVAVRDFRRRRTITVRAGKKYLARAP